MELIALFLLLVVGLSLFKRWWWISVFVPKYKDETVSMFVRWPWRCRLFNNKCGRKIIRFVCVWWHHKIMRRHVKTTTFIGNTISGKRQKKDFWTCWCGFAFSWEPIEN